MYAKSIFFLSALTALSTALPSALEARQVSPVWYLRSILRTCDNVSKPQTCTFTYGIDEQNGSAPFHCTYTISNAIMPSVSANNTGYQNQECNGSGEFSINSGWDPTGFTVIVIKDFVSGLWAFFGVNDQQFNAGTVRPDPAAADAKIGVFPPPAPSNNMVGMVGVA